MNSMNMVILKDLQVRQKTVLAKEETMNLESSSQ